MTAYYAHYAESERMWTPAEKLAELPRKCFTPSLSSLTDALHRYHARGCPSVCARIFRKDVHRDPRSREHGLRGTSGICERSICRADRDAILQAAKALQDMVERVLSTQPLSAPEKLGDRSLLLPPGMSARLALLFLGRTDPCLSVRARLEDVRAQQEQRQLFLRILLPSRRCPGRPPPTAAIIARSTRSRTSVQRSSYQGTTWLPCLLFRSGRNRINGFPNPPAVRETGGVP